MAAYLHKTYEKLGILEKPGFLNFSANKLQACQ